MISEGRVSLTTSFKTLEEAHSTIVCLPTPLNDNSEPDLSIVTSGLREAARHLRPGGLVVIESTTYPGMTREVVLPILEEGGRLGEDFYLAFSPERTDPGNAEYGLNNTPKVVGGMTPECSRRAEELYGLITETHAVPDPESAEFTKLLENVFRAANIALINELAVICERMGLDIWTIIEAAKTKPFGFMAFYPGPGIGGHCIPVDPLYLSWRAKSFEASTEMVDLASHINSKMPDHAFERITAALNASKKPVNGSRVLVLGVSYKPNIGDLRESPVLKIIRLLDESGASVAYHDPHVPSLDDRDLSSVELCREELEGADCVVIATDHEALDLEVVVGHARMVIDLRNAVRDRLGRLPESVQVL